MRWAWLGRVIGGKLTIYQRNDGGSVEGTGNVDKSDSIMLTLKR